MCEHGLKIVLVQVWSNVFKHKLFIQICGERSCPLNVKLFTQCELHSPLFYLSKIFHHTSVFFSVVCFRWIFHTPLRHLFQPFNLLPLPATYFNHISYSSRYYVSFSRVFHSFVSTIFSCRFFFHLFLLATSSFHVPKSSTRSCSLPLPNTLLHSLCSYCISAHSPTQNPSQHRNYYISFP